MLPAGVSGEVLIRLGCFVGIFLAMAVLEVFFPRRARHVPRRARWGHNLGISTINQTLVRLALPISAIVLADVCAEQRWGLLNMFSMPHWARLLIAVVALDLAIYLQHVLLHAVPALWRIHRMHHADTEFDVTTGIRFHPLSILLSATLKLGAILLIGAPAHAVLIFEVLLNATSLFNHSNIHIPAIVERFIRLLVVTPDTHRVHHSTDPAEMSCNFGFNFPWWDRLFGTYRDQPALGHEQMVIGLTSFRSDSELRIDQMLTQPFRNAADDEDNEDTKAGT